ncbi:RNA-dependent RNA polymerase [Kitale virus]|uniref:RNA-directed RNA polymerase L n=3 Tax=Arenaviridae TaxID=11617 RepID=A0A6B9KVS2_9VIRU|nr:RNA-dependent RNA polymerase [Kitale virus]QHB13141.1 RNA-dependent RNA polymerase [Kitale virus]
MEELVKESKDLISRYLKADPRLSRQRVSFLSQMEPRFLLMEGLKLLSLCIEIDSCESNSCDHNSENLSVENYLFKNNILTPGLSFVVPDGVKLNGNVLILLECFVRSSTSGFQQKYLEDAKKLEGLKADLERVNISMIPIIDGRTTFYNSFMDEWVCDRLRVLLFKLLEFEQQSNAMFEESEYQRLCESLSATGGKISGLEALNSIKDLRSDHSEGILEQCHLNVTANMTPLQIKSEVEKHYTVFKHKLKTGLIKESFRRVDKHQLLREFSELYSSELSHYAAFEDITNLETAFVNLSPILRFLHLDITNVGTQEPSCVPSNIVASLRSLFNKLKSLRVLNTRRKLMLLIDAALLMGHFVLMKQNGAIEEGGWLGSSFFSVNDRLVSLSATQEDLSKWLKRKMSTKECKGLSKETIFSSMMSKLFSKCDQVLNKINLSAASYGVKWTDLEHVRLKDIMELRITGKTPTMSYEKRDAKEIKVKLRSFSTDTNLDLDLLSSLSLSLVNSMKTSSAVKLRQNELGKNRYKIVRCKEAYYQEIKTHGYRCYLLYQKTGEGSKCYSVNDAEVGEICSFYADPKRYFCPIFSQDVIAEMQSVMLSWLEGCSELEAQFYEVKSLLKMIILLILAHPSKRAQRFLQNIRYFIMAYVSDFHHVKLLEKLKEDLITEVEYFLYRLLRRLLQILLNPEVKLLMNNRFKFILNVSYLCHLITKETPDRLTDQIKCFEKFLEPKVQFGCLFTNPLEQPSTAEIDELMDGVKTFVSKTDCLDQDDIEFGQPGVSKRIFSLMVSAANSNLLFHADELARGFKDPIETSGSATALDLASNKSVVVNKFHNGERILNYDYDKLTSVAVCQLSEIFKRKGKYLLNKDDYDYKVQEVISSLVLGKSAKVDKKGGQVKDPLNVEMVQDLGVDLDYLDSLKESVDRVLNRYKPSLNKGIGSQSRSARQGSIHDLDMIVSGKVEKEIIITELSYHLVEDFDRSLLSEDFYQEFCERTHTQPDLRERYFYDVQSGICPVEEMTRALSTRTYDAGEYFQCFKSILLQMDANKLSGRYSHYKSKCVGFKFDHGKLMSDVRISERQSNSEALSSALSLVNCLTSALKNLCFYSQESPTSYTSFGPDTGRLKFSLSYKEQVGGNRELYIGDLRTKMFTRLVEDYFECYTNQFSGSCLNNEKEFERAILSMKLSVSLGHINYSMDHSKWGPMMCPFLFLMLYRNLVIPLKNGNETLRSRENVSTILCWHIHKMIEVPFNVVSAMMKSYVKRRLGLMKDTSQTLTETMFFSDFERGVVPSHMSSVLDMGQGILHNTSDFYGLISERFINFAIKCVFGDSIESYTSSDDQISLFDLRFNELLEKDPEEFLLLLEFHHYLSDRLNKFVSPKSVIGRLVAEFKSRFFVWGDEVPLLTKFVAASLHNIKCKEPHQLAETIDTIVDQSVANGVPISLCNMIQKRVIYLLEYSNYPIDPFLLFCDSDVKDWVDGNRGYRIMRNIEKIIPKGTERIRSMLRKLYNKLKTNELHEEFAASYLSQNRADSIKKLCTLMGDEPPDDGDLSVHWLSLSNYLPIRMVLRQKVVYPSVLSLDEERIPTIVKTLQNKLSSGFTRGAQKLLSEAVNKSAFQSSIASGFVGLCKTLGSKCVRNNNRETFYIKAVLNKLQNMTGISFVKQGSVNLWVIDSYNQGPGEVWEVGLLRPLLWDYLCITLSTSLEIGPWVLGNPEQKLIPRKWRRRPCDYFPLKPCHTRILEDRVSLNHILHSIRRQYPDIFEKHLMPYMSDLAAMKLKWSPRIKFLDLCVVLDVNCEALSLVSHVVKWKREEHYIVLSDDLSFSHERKHTPLTEERVVTTSDVASNFIKQVYFESYVRPFVITSRTIGSFSWFPHKSSLPMSEGLEKLGPFSTFVEKVVYKGIERPMYRYDLFSGYTWLDFEVEPATFSVAQLVQLGLTETKCCTDYEYFWDLLVANGADKVQMCKSIRFNLKGKESFSSQRFAVHLRFTGKAVEGLLFRPLKVEVSYSGSVDSTYLMDCWSMAKLDSEFHEGLVEWVVSTDTVNEYLRDNVLGSEALVVEVDLSQISLDFHEGDMVRVGPEFENVPLVLKNGCLYEKERAVASLEPALLTQDIELFITELEEDHWDLLNESFSKMLRNRFEQGSHMRQVDLLKATSSLCRERTLHLLTRGLKDLNDWFDFEGLSLCFSSSKGKVMRHTSTGRMRLKGRLCSCFWEDEVVEDIC